MKKILSMIAAQLLLLAATAQTLNVATAGQTDQYPSAQTGQMTFTDGTQLTILGKTYSLSDISKMYTDETIVTDNQVTVSYSGTTAQVFVAGNIAQYVTATVSGAHVSIEQSSSVDDTVGEITYVLSGTSTDGEFAMSGSYKATVELNGLTLTNPTGAAINIANGKRIAVSAKNGTVNTLADGSGSQKACLYVKGHLELKGKGVLNVYGNYAHAIKSGDYTSVKNLTLNVLSAVKDGISANEYFLMTSGVVTIGGVGDDGIQAELDGTTNTGQTTDHEDEDSGNIYIDGGTLSLTTTAAGAKGLKADSTVVVTDGTITINASGSVDTSDSTDPSYVAGISAGKFVQNGGSIDITVKGTAGRGVKAYDVETNSGSLTIINSAAPTTISSDVKGAKGIKALRLALNGGTITITMSGNASKAIRVGDGTQSSGGSSGGGGGRPGWGGGGMGWGGMGGSSSWTNVSGSYTQGLSDGSGPTLKVTQTGSAYSSSSAKAIKAICAITILGGTTEVSTSTNGAEGLESKTSIDIQGGQHYFKCYDDCINSAGKITFSGGTTVCYLFGNDAVDSNAGTTGAITIGNGTVFAYTTKGAPEEGFDCDNNSYIQITGTGIGISAGGAQGGGSSSSTISNAKQGYAFVTSTIRYTTGNYYTLADASGNNLVTYSFEG
ncbi:MAG: carbohydrate-binding domain-containing protein, partial [Prevotella sp.]|nr:carbohydrate-binding domain-containing protein [Prevotella sp.]